MDTTVARLEARRHAGVAELIERARAGDLDAVRGLGRVGGAEAVAALRAGSPSAHVIDALWLAGATDAAADLAARYTAEAPVEVRVAVVRALGRLGSAEQLPVLAAALADAAPEVRAEAAIALGIYGRRAIAWSPEARAALRALVPATEAERYGVAYAFAKEHAWNPRELDGDAEAVHRLAGSGDETRALNVPTLARYGVAYTRPFAPGDWLTQVAFVREYADGNPGAIDSGKLFGWDAPVAEIVARPGGAHVLREALVALRPRAATWHALYERIAAGAGDEHAGLRCLARAVQAVRARSLEPVLACEPWPSHLHAALVIEVIGELGREPGTDGAAALLDGYARDPDPRVRAPAIAAVIARGSEEHEDLVLAAIDDPDPAVAGSAAEAIAARRDVPAGWTQALLARARRSVDDPELIATLLDALVALDAADAVAAAGVQPLCAQLAAHWNRTIRDKARACAGDAPAQAPAPPPALAADPADVAGRRVTWRVTTSRGAFAIELRPDVAPIAVAALTKLARAGFYDGLTWHRVVPGFVVQGGDPTGTGWGGPGFLLPGEPSALPFSRGAVGIADAGPDTGGCQLFVMHARAPHLEGRYTLIGHVTEGMAVVDQLVVGDRIERVEVELR